MRTLARRPATTMYTPLEDLFHLPLGTQLSYIALPILEVYPLVSNADAGHRQELRFRIPGTAVFSLYLYDRPEQVPVALQGGVLRATGSPNLHNAIVWGRARAHKPATGIGHLAIRPAARLELYGREHTAGLAAQLGFRVSVPTEVPARRPVAPAAVPRPPLVSPPPAARAEPGRQLPVVAGPLVEQARFFGECLAAARAALGADDTLIRETARFLYEGREFRPDPKAMAEQARRYGECLLAARAASKGGTENDLREIAQFLYAQERAEQERVEHAG